MGYALLITDTTLTSSTILESCKKVEREKKGKNFLGSSFYANTHLLSDRGDTCSTLATWLVGGKGSLTELFNQFFSDGCVCKASQATPGLLNM